MALLLINTSNIIKGQIAVLCGYIHAYRHYQKGSAEYMTSSPLMGYYELTVTDSVLADSLHTLYQVPVAQYVTIQVFSPKYIPY